jgi:hypothetical protein
VTESRRVPFSQYFRKNQLQKLDYIAIISRALNVPQGELLEPGNTRETLAPVQLELIEIVSNQDEKMIRRLIPLIKGVILAEMGKQ